jgi:hypothetical protein
MFVLLAPAAQYLGVDLRRPCQEKVYGSMIGAMARIAPPQPNEAMARISPPLFSAAAQRQHNKTLLVPSK